MPAPPTRSSLFPTGSLAPAAAKSLWGDFYDYVVALLGVAGPGFDGALLAATRRVTFGGTADAITSTLAPAPSAYVAGMRVTGLLPGANTVTGPTLNLNAFGAKTIKKRSGTGAKVALVVGDYDGTLPFEFEYDGTDMILLNPLGSPSLSAIQTWTAKQIFTATVKLQGVIEKCPSSATVATGTINFDWLTQAVLNYTSNAAANWTLSIRGDGSTSLNSLMAVDESITITHNVPQGGTAYYNNAIKIDGNASGENGYTLTTKWLGGTPASGDVSSINVYSYTVMKTADKAFTILASKSKYS